MLNTVGPDTLPPVGVAIAFNADVTDTAVAIAGTSGASYATCAGGGTSPADPLGQKFSAFAPPFGSGVGRGWWRGIGFRREGRDRRAGTRHGSSNLTPLLSSHPTLAPAFPYSSITTATARLCAPPSAPYSLGVAGV